MFFDFVRLIGTVFQRLVEWYWQLVTSLWSTCVRGPCYWWCLCCDRWLCVIFLIIVAILAFLLFVIFFLLYFFVTLGAWITCELLCLFIAVVFVMPANILAVIGWIIFSLGRGEPPLLDPPACFKLDRPPTRRPPGQDKGGLTSPGDPTGGGGTPGPTTGPTTGTTTGTTTATTTSPSDAAARARPLLSWPRSADEGRRAGRAGRSAYCGCREGRVGIVLALATLLVFRTAVGWEGAPISAHLGVAVAVALLGALVGKGVGMSRARREGDGTTPTWPGEPGVQA